MTYHTDEAGLPATAVTRERLLTAAQGHLPLSHALATGMLPLGAPLPLAPLMRYARSLRSLTLLQGLTMVDAYRSSVMLDLTDDAEERMMGAWSAWADTALPAAVDACLAAGAIAPFDAVRDAAISRGDWLGAWLAERAWGMVVGAQAWPDVRERILNDLTAFSQAETALRAQPAGQALMAALAARAWSVAVAIEVVIRLQMEVPLQSDEWWWWSLNNRELPRTPMPIPDKDAWVRARRQYVDSTDGVSACDGCGQEGRTDRYLRYIMPVRELARAILAEQVLPMYGGWEPTTVDDIPPLLAEFEDDVVVRQALLNLRQARAESARLAAKPGPTAEQIEAAIRRQLALDAAGADVTNPPLSLD